VRNIKDTIGRADAFKTMAKKSGATIKTLLDYRPLRRHCGVRGA
jgi:uncharacterized protein with GYD domain